MIAQMLTDKKVTGLSGRGDSITVLQQISVALFGKSSAAIIDSKSIFEASSNNENVKLNETEFSLALFCLSYIKEQQ